LDPLAITIRAEHLLNRIISPVTVQQSAAFCLRRNIPVKPLDVRAMWDTGSKLTCVSTKIARYLDLKKVDSLELTSIHGSDISNVYLVDIILPDGITIANVTAAEIDSGEEFEILIGMNIISLGDFAITNNNGETVFSFRLPTANLPIDFS
jgi:hypothetical protein